MAAPKGHPLWGNPLNPKKLTPEELWNGACEYFQWCDDNPIIIEDFIKSGAMGGEKVYINHRRAYNIERLCIFLDISDMTFSNYSKATGYETYFEICTRIKKIIDSQHFEGAMSGTFNASIAAMKLGLQQKIQSNQTISITSMNPEEEAELKKAFEDAKKDENIS